MLVRDQQVTLFRLGFDCKGVDGVDGPNTRAARAAFHASRGFPKEGGLDSAGFQLTLAAAALQLPPFIQSRNYTPAVRPWKDPINWIVIHTMQSAETPAQALGCAKWFGGLLLPTYPPPQASTHYMVDNAAIAQGVLECDVAWGAGGANRNGIHIEHSGVAQQTGAQWHDDYSSAVLKRSAELVAKLCKRFSIPMQWLTAEQLAAGGRGITGHLECTQAFKQGDHTDPGPNFPRDEYVAMVKEFAAV